VALLTSLCPRSLFPALNGDLSTRVPPAVVFIIVTIIFGVTLVPAMFIRGVVEKTKAASR